MLLNIALLGQYIQNLDFDLYTSNDNMLFSPYVDFVVLITCIKTYVHTEPLPLLKVLNNGEQVHQEHPQDSYHYSAVHVSVSWVLAVQ